MNCKERICEIIHYLTGIPVESIDPNSGARELRLDSLDMAEVISEVEEEFDVIVENEDGISTVSDLVHCVEAQIA